VDASTAGCRIAQELTGPAANIGHHQCSHSSAHRVLDSARPISARNSRPSERAGQAGPQRSEEELDRRFTIERLAEIPCPPRIAPWRASHRRRTSREGSGRTRRPPEAGRSERSDPRPTFCGRSAKSPARNTFPPDAACGVRWKGVLSCRTAQSVLSAYRRSWYNCDRCIPICPTASPPGPKSSPTGTCAAHWRRRSYRTRWHRSLNLPRHSCGSRSRDSTATA
jgi:hypothetical protein